MIKVAINGINGTEIEYNTFVFSGGEVHVHFNNNFPCNADVVITASLTSSEEIMRLMMINEALSQYTPASKMLVMGYIPYARQDRRCITGEAFSLKVFCQLINSMEFDEVYVLDPHSDVSTALINNVVVVSQLDIIHNHQVTSNLMYNSIAVSPDAGANKKTNAIAVTAGKPFIRADKIRSVTDGAIIGTEVYCDDLEGQEVTIWDDICDGGRTFIELAKKLKEKNAGKINLYVTHGIFSKGIDVLVDSGIDTIYTTNTLNQEPHGNLVILEEM